METRVKVMVVDYAAGGHFVPGGELDHSGFSLAGILGPGDDWVAGVRRAEPDIVMIDSPRVDETLLFKVKAVQAQAPVPIALFSDDSGRDQIFSAIDAGVNAFFAGSMGTNKLRHAADVAFAQFSTLSNLRQAAAKANAALAERKVVERAKGIVMKSRGLDEDEAYTLMRRMAMSRNTRLIRLAETIIQAQELAAADIAARREPDVAAQTAHG